MAFWILAALAPSDGLAQQGGRLFAGGLVGVSTLSADARSTVATGAARASLYKPENGPALNALVGVHASTVFSIQANYIWNRNDLTLFSSAVAADMQGFYEQMRPSAQQALFVDALLYFRARASRVRPYLSAGVGRVWFDSRMPTRTVENGLAAPVGDIVAARKGLRVAVGIDLRIAPRTSVRYSFSETISGNPVSGRLSPPGERNLANFQNLFGLVVDLD